MTDGQLLVLTFVAFLTLLGGMEYARGAMRRRWLVKLAQNSKLPGPVAGPLPPAVPAGPDFTVVGAGASRAVPVPATTHGVAAEAAAQLLFDLEVCQANGDTDDLDHAVRVLALVACGAASFQDAARFYADSGWTAGEGDWEPPWFFTSCVVCRGDLVTVGCHDSTPEACAACPEPEVGRE